MFLSLKYSNMQNIITSLEEIETNSVKTKVDFNPEDEDLPDWAKS